MTSSTYSSIGGLKWSHFVQSAGLPTTKAMECWNLCNTFSWWNSAPNPNSQWKSDVSLDNTPFEFSLSLEQDIEDNEARIVVEPLQDPSPTIKSARNAAILFNSRLEEYFKCQFTDVQKLSHLFYPDEPQGSFSSWYSFCVGKNSVGLKIYFNLECQGNSKVHELCKEALNILGASELQSHVDNLICAGAVLKYIGLDLVSQSQKRVKVYIIYPNVSLRDAQNKLSEHHLLPGGDNNTSNNRPSICDLGSYFVDDVNKVLQQPYILCLNLDKLGGKTLPNVSFGIPVSRVTDQILSEKFSAYLKHYHSEEQVQLYNRCLKSAISRPLENGCGGHSYVGFKYKGDGKLVTTIYISSEVNTTV